MGRILAVDYGSQRCGLAWTNPSQTIATPLDPVPESQLLSKLKEILALETIDLLVLGKPLKLDSTPTHATKLVEDLAEKLKAEFPNLEIDFWDERFTSKIAQNSMIQAGVKKAKRKEKMLINSISATIILQSYLAYTEKKIK